MKVWVDLSTGTYGNVDELVIADVPVDVLEQWDYGQVSDEDIIWQTINFPIWPVAP